MHAYPRMILGVLVEGRPVLLYVLQYDIMIYMI